MAYIITGAIALFGAVIASFLGLPMGAIFGAAALIISAAKIGLPLHLPRHTLTFVQLILGMAVGLTIPAGIFNRALPILPLLGLIGCICGQILAAYLWLHKRERWSRFDSLLGAVPGALGAVLAVDETQQKPSGRVIFIHSIRLACLVMLSGLIVAADHQNSYHPLLAQQNLWLLAPLASAFMTGIALEKIGIPAPHIITGMASTIILGATMPESSLTVPSPIIFIASAAFGAIVGMRLKDITLRDFTTHIRAGIVATALSLLVTAASAFGFSQITDKDFTVLLMAWAPGSMETMTVVAVYLGLEPAFILLNHSIRMLILYTIPISLGWYNRRRKHN